MTHEINHSQVLVSIATQDAHCMAAVLHALCAANATHDDEQVQQLIAGFASELSAHIGGIEAAYMDSLQMLSDTLRPATKSRKARK